MSTINLQNGNTLLSTGFFPPVRAASTGSPLNPATGGLLVVDGIQLAAGDRVLVKDEASAVNNGIYAAQTGPWTRTMDASTNTQFFSGMAVVVALGTINKGQIYLCTCTDDPVVVGTSLLTFAEIQSIQGGSGGGPANPTATVGLSVVNGSALTFMRSDAAPPLSQAIAPTWTALHTFSAGAVWGATSPGLPTIGSGELYYNNTGGGNTEHNAALNIAVDTGATAPSAVVPAAFIFVESKGTNATFVGGAGLFIQAGDRADVNSSNKGVLYALDINIAPSVTRNNSPYDDADGLIINNVGSAQATEAIYLAHNSGLTQDWSSCITIAAYASSAIRLNGTYGYGLDFVSGAIATINDQAIRLPNGAWAGGRNAANSADVNAWKIDGSNLLSLANATVTIDPATGNIVTSGTVNKVTITAPASAATLTIASGKTLTVDNSLTFAGTDSTTMTFPGASDTVVTLTAMQTLTSKTLTAPVIASINGNSGATGTLSTGTNGGTGGQLTLNGSTSGSASISVAATGGQLTLNTVTISATGAVTTNALDVTGTFGTQPPATLTGTSGTITNTSTIINSSGTFTVTLPSASGFDGEWLYIKNAAANAVNSASSNVVPLGSTSPGTAILASSGKAAALQSDGTNWQVMWAV